MSADKKVKKAVVKWLKKNNPVNESISLKKLRKNVKISLKESNEESNNDDDIDITKESFENIIQKLEKKGRIIRTNNKVLLNLDWQKPIKPNKSTVFMNNDDHSFNGKENQIEDCLPDEQTIIDRANNSLMKSQTSTSIDPTKKKYVIDPSLEHGDATILLFYTYCTPIMTRAEQDAAIAHCYNTASANGMTGRLRVGREGFNGTLTGMHDSVRIFTTSLRTTYPAIFGQTDFKYVDGQPERFLLKGLKVWPVTEIVTYGFDPRLAPLEMTGNHLSPADFHRAMEDPNSVVIDVRNFNESLIGNEEDLAKAKAEKVLDPCMRRSTEFPDWVLKNKHKLEGKKVLMYCTAGVRCERASAYIRNMGIEDVNQLAGGIHRYLEAYSEDGGHWIGKNYVFDKRFAHGATEPWERYQAQAKVRALINIIIKKHTLYCPLCVGKKPGSQSSFKPFKKMGKDEEEFFG
eukprot:gene7009-14264_t